MIRIYVHRVHESESMLFRATAFCDGVPLITIEEYGGPEAERVVVAKLSKKLTVEGYDAPDDYWKQKFRVGPEGYLRSEPEKGRVVDD